MAIVKGPGFTLRWNPNILKSKLNKELHRLAHRIGDEGVHYMQGILNEPHPPSSSPGEPPRKRTGDLQNSVSYEVFEDSLGVGVSVGSDESKLSREYATYLELGTARMSGARPFIAPTFDHIKRVWPGKVRQSI